MSHRVCFRPGWILALILALASTALAAQWKEQVLYSFQGGTGDGFWPAGGVVFDKQGNLYGATTGGGSGSCLPISEECGLVFQLAPPVKKGDPWTETILYQFKGKGVNDASAPTGGVILDNAGNVYGVTAYGGTGDCVLLGTKAGCGTVYELSPPSKKGNPWTETILHSFISGNDGYFPWGTLTFDAKGNLYGATQFGGGKGNTCNEFYGGNCGTVFKLTPPKQKGGQWTEKVLHRFAGLASGKQTGDGANPNGGLVFDSKGAIYGTTQFGGYNCPHSSDQGCGTVFKFSPPKRGRGKWVETILYSFKGAPDDSGTPNGNLVFGAEGKLYGTTVGGGGSADDGAVFELASPTTRNVDWREALLQSFVDEGDPNGANPRGGLTFGSGGDLYGTANSAGTHFDGTFFRLRPSRSERAGWRFARLYSFGGPPDAAFPTGELILDALGNVYGATQNGGTGTACQFGCGTVFEVSPP